MKPTYTRLIDNRLIEAIKNGTCVLFVGAGLSSDAITQDGNKLPSWKELLKRLLQLAQDDGVDFLSDSNDITKMIDNSNYLMAAQELQERIPPPTLGRFFQSILGGASPVDIHKIIPFIPFRAIITSNYDSLLEGGHALMRNGVLPPVKTQVDLRNDRPSLRFGGEFFIFKLHGDINRQETIVLGTRDYQKLLFDSLAYRQFLETLFSAYTVLFAGFGATDPDLLNVLEKLSAFYRGYPEKHYILLPDNRYSVTEKRRITNDLGLILINYEVYKSNINGKTTEDHSQVTEFFQTIKNRLYQEIVTTVPISLVERAKKCQVFIISAPQDTVFSSRIASELQKKLGEEAVWLTATVKAEFEEVSHLIQQVAAEALQNATNIIIVISNDAVKLPGIENEISVALDYARSKQAQIAVANIRETELPEGLKMFPSHIKPKNKWRKSDFTQFASLVIPQTSSSAVYLTTSLYESAIEYFSLYNKPDLIDYNLHYKLDLQSSFTKQSQLKWPIIKTLLPLIKTEHAERVDGALLGFPEGESFLMPMIKQIVKVNDSNVDFVLQSDNENWAIEIRSGSLSAGTRDANTIAKLLQEQDRISKTATFNRIWLIVENDISNLIRNQLCQNKILHSSSDQFIQLLRQLLVKSETLP